MLKSILGLIIVILLSYLAITGIPQKGYFPMHDDTQVTRVYEMKLALADGIFPVRWSQNLGYGYGYPIFNFYAPLAYYTGGFLDLYFYDSLTATKAMIAIGLMLAGITMYFLGKSLWNPIGGTVAAILYMFAPYHALNVYVRGAVAETYAYAFVPLAFYGLWKVSTDRKWRYVIIGAFGLAGVILSHNLTALMLLPFYGITVLLLSIITWRNIRTVSWVLIPLTGIIGTGIAAFYWLPALSEMQFTNVMSQVGGGADFRDHFVCLTQLWESQWGFGGSVPGCVDGLSLKIGKLHIIASILAVALGFILLKFDKGKRTILLGIFGALLVSVFLTLPQSTIIWEAISPMAYFQFPWRFLLLCSFFTSLLIGAIPYALSNLTIKGTTVKYLPFIVGGVLVVGTVLLYQKLFIPQTVYEEPKVDYTDPETIRWEISKISDEYMPKNFEKPTSEDDLIESKITAIDSIPTIGIDYESTNSVEAYIATVQPITVLVNTAPFPAWQMYLNEEEITYTATNSGMLVAIPQGEHTLLTVFEETPVEKNGNLISLAGISLLVLGIIVAWWKRFL